MQIEVLKSKLHCVTVTEANLNYMGSITIDEDLMDAAGLIAGEKVQIVDNNNGERLETYIIKGERGSGCICLNGAAARKVQVGDTVIIIAYALMDFEEAKAYRPTVVFPKEGNKISFAQIRERFLGTCCPLLVHRCPTACSLKDQGLFTEGPSLGHRWLVVVETGEVVDAFVFHQTGVKQ